MLSVHLGFVLTGVVTTMLGPMLPKLASMWQLDDATAGTLFTVQFVFSALATLTSGRLMALYSLRTVVIAGFCFMATGVAVLATAVHSWSPVIAGICCYGIGLGLNMPAVNLLIAATFPERRASALSLLNFAWSAGAILAPILLALSFQRLSFATTFGILAVLIVLAAVAVWRTTDAPERVATTPSGKKTLSAADLMGIVLLSLMIMLYVGTETAVGGWIATYAHRVAATNLGAVAQSAFWAALLAGRCMAPYVLSRMRELPFIMLGLAIALAGTLVVLLTANPLSIAAGATVAGLGLAGIFPTAVAVMAGLFGRGAEARMGPIFAVFGLGGAAMPWIVGLVSRHFSDLWAGMAVAVFAVIAMMAFNLLAWKIAPQRSNVEIAEKGAPASC